MTTLYHVYRASRVERGILISIQCLGALLLTIFSLILPNQVEGLGLRIPNQDAEAIARGNAFVATADNPSALYYNPAGITQLKGQNLQVGVLNYLGINTSYDSPTGTHTHSRFEVLPVPQVHYTYSPEKLPLAFGIGVYAPFGLGTLWPEDSSFRSLAIEARLQYVTLNPIVAWKVAPTLSLAIGPTVNYSKLRFRRGLAAPGDLLEFNGDDVAYGLHAGVLWQPHPQWSFGANYRSATTIDYGGTTRYNPGFASPSIAVPPAPTTARVKYPDIISGGISYRPTSKWNIEVNVDWSNWETLDSVTLKGTKNLGFPIDLPLALNWHGSWLYEFGVSRYFQNGWFASAGYFFCGETVRETYFNPAVPDTDLHVGSLGFGHKAERWAWTVAAQIITAPAREIQTSLANPFTGESANGKYQLVVPTLSFSLGYHF
jgi:long-chain fatty acid transport protein